MLPLANVTLASPGRTAAAPLVTLPIVVYMIAMTLITVVSVFLAAETARSDISAESRAADQRRVVT